MDQPLILLAEDREDDVTLIRKAFKEAQVETAIQVVRDGEEAISYLSGEGIYSDREEYPLPWLVLLDLKMPRVDGFEVLSWVRVQPSLRSIVIVVLTSSEQLRDVNRAYALGANSFMVKPVDFENAAALANLIHLYWLRHNRLPETTRESPKKINGGKETG